MKNKKLKINLFYICIFYSFYLIFNASSAFCVEPYIFTLKKAIKIATENNNNMIVAREEVKKAKGALMQARGRALPSLSLTGTYTHQSQLSSFNIGGVSMTFGRNDTYSSQLTLSQPIFVGGKIVRGIQISSLGLDIANLGLEGQERETVYETIQSFYSCLLAKELVEINSEAVTRLEENYNSTKIRYQRGIVPEIHLLRAKVELENAKPSLLEAKNNLILSIKNLKRILNTKEDFFIDGKLLYKPYIIEDKETLKQKLLDSYPLLGQLEKTIDMQRKNISIARSSHWPSIYLSSNYILKVTEGSFSMGGPEGSWNAMVTFELPLFKGFQTLGAVKEAKAVHEQSQKEYKENKALILIQFEKAWNKLIESEKIIKSQKLNVKRAKKSYDIIRIRYAKGLNSYLDLLSVQLALKQAKVHFAQSVYNYITSKANLEKLAGVTLKPINKGSVQND